MSPARHRPMKLIITFISVSVRIKISAAVFANNLSPRNIKTVVKFFGVF
jgi:hypothetical protein